LEANAIDVLNRNRLLALATLRADGWPQNTIVGYANERLLVYFMISRESQKYRNILADNRVSIAIGQDFHDPATIHGLSMGAHASEVTDSEQRVHAIDLFLQRHPGLKKLERPDLQNSAVMRAFPSIVTIIDYSKGFGHADVLTVGAAGIAEMTPARPDNWGFGSQRKPVS
jgi:nitroimidazol reductase NimA-like FMN-containing flavoprotein (pyridoxamine 5'-phosphate oxidase superfamily)